MGRRYEKKLNARMVANVTKPGRYSDGGGLYLFISRGGRQRWVFMYTRAGKRTELGLGSARDVGLADARDEAATMRAAIARGEDPRALRAKAHAPKTFGECADEHIEAMRPSWKSKKHADQWEMTLRKYASPLRPKLIDEVTTNDVLEVLKPLWHKIPETADRLRGRIEAVLDSAKARGLRSGENPARWRGHLSLLLPKRTKLSRGHHKALPYREVPKFYQRLRARRGRAARALEYTILTAARTTETLEAVRSEVDFATKVWEVPAERMKWPEPHRVPLSDRAIEILREMESHASGDSDLIFPGYKRGKPLSNMAMLNLLSRMDIDATVHGFRSSFTDWAAEETGFPRMAIEMALAHTIEDKTEEAYRRGDLLKKRRKLMVAWAEYCLSARLAGSG